LNQLEPSYGVDLSGSELAKAGRVLDNARKLGAQVFIRPVDIVEGNKRLNAAFVAQIFNARHGLSVDPIEDVLKLLKSGEASAREQGAKKILELAADPELKKRLIKEILPLLFKLEDEAAVGSSEKAALLAAIEALTASELDSNAEVQKILLENLPYLVKMLAQGDEAEKTYALAALYALSQNPENAGALVKAGVVPPLLAIIANGKDDAQKEKALATLLNISKDGSADIKASLLANIPQLLATLEKGSDKQKELAYQTLLSLFNGDDDEVMAAFAKPLSIAALIRILEKGDEPYKTFALKVIYALSKRLAYDVILVRAGVLPHGLVTITLSGNDDQKDLGLQTINNLSKAAANKVDIIQEAFSVLTIYVESDNGKLKAVAIDTLKNLVDGSSDEGAVVEAALKVDLVRLLLKLLELAFTGKL
jgi:hypothetical protein